MRVDIFQQQEKKAKEHTEKRFTQIRDVTTWSARCYREWYEIWETKDGSVVTEEDIAAFQAQPRGQGHRVEQYSETSVKLTCICDWGD
jgi:hypothetical protein